MPAAFAHDLYGRLVYRQLKPDIRQVLRREKDCFYLGLHGPDVLFYYRPLGENAVNKKGYRLHESPAMAVFEHGVRLVREEKDERRREALCAYLLGFSCHFALDHSLHGYINETARTTAFTHGDIETELDRRLLVREGKIPLRTNVVCHLRKTEMTCMAASAVLSESEECLGEAILTFKAVNRLFINSCEPVKDAVCLVLRAAGYYEKIHGMLMRKRPAAGLLGVTDYLEREFLNTVPFGVSLALGLYRSMKEGTPLPREFMGDFEGGQAIEGKEQKES